MKADELMVGDWVHNDLGETQQVVELREEGVMLYYNDIYPYDDIQPIPLTPEILEKNGFKIIHGFGYSESYPTYGWGYHKGLRDYAFVDVTFYDEPIGGVSRLVKMETASKKDDGINSIHSCDIEFIHELQHALRLCGIKKEIEL